MVDQLYNKVLGGHIDTMQRKLYKVLYIRHTMVYTCDYDKDTEKIAKVLKERNITKIRKSDLRRMFDLGSHKAVVIYSGLCKLGWIETWSYLEKPNA